MEHSDNNLADNASKMSLVATDSGKLKKPGKCFIINLCIIAATFTGLGFLALLTYKEVKDVYPLTGTDKIIEFETRHEGVYGLWHIYRTDMVIEQGGVKSVLCKGNVALKNTKPHSKLKLYYADIIFKIQPVTMFKNRYSPYDKVVLWTSGNIDLPSSPLSNEYTHIHSFNLLVPIVYYKEANKIDAEISYNHEAVEKKPWEMEYQVDPIQSNKNLKEHKSTSGKWLDDAVVVDEVPPKWEETVPVNGNEKIKKEPKGNTTGKSGEGEYINPTPAPLDKSEGYFQSRYGAPGHVEQNSDGSKNMFYIEGPYIIVATFIKKQSVSIAYGKSEGEGDAREQVALLDDEIKKLLEAYSDGYKWKPVDMNRVKETREKYATGASKMWKRSDGKLVANYQSDAQFLHFAKPDYLMNGK